MKWCSLFRSVFVSAFLFTFIFTTDALAEDWPTISRAKGKKVLIKKNLSDVPVGTVYFALDANGKRRGLIRITKSGKSKALGKIVKGKARKGWVLKTKEELLSGSPSTAPAEPAQEEETTEETTREVGKSQVGGWDLGLNLGMSLYSMTVDIPVNNTTTQAAMSGSGLGYHVFVRYHWSKSLDIEASAGLENFSVTGEVTDSSCSGSNNCETKINYLVGNLLAKYKFGMGSFRPWITGGLGLMNPSSSESNALEAESINMTLTFIAGAGLDWHLGKSWYVPIAVKYTLFPPSDNVSANYIAIHGGVGFDF